MELRDVAEAAAFGERVIRDRKQPALILASPMGTLGGCINLAALCASMATIRGHPGRDHSKVVWTFIDKAVGAS